MIIIPYTWVFSKNFRSIYDDSNRLITEIAWPKPVSSFNCNSFKYQFTFLYLGQSYCVYTEFSGDSSSNSTTFSLECGQDVIAKGHEVQGSAMSLATFFITHPFKARFKQESRYKLNYSLLAMDSNIVLGKMTDTTKFLAISRQATFSSNTNISIPVQIFLSFCTLNMKEWRPIS